jgi:hypothetical protein
MPVTEQLQTVTTDPNAPDPNVVVPAHVRAAADAAAAAHAAAYAPAEVVKTPEELAAETEAARVAALPSEQQQLVVPPQNDFTAPADAAALQSDPWAQRYNSMRGRWEAATRTIGSMEEQMRQLGQELVRTQSILAAAPQQTDLGQNNNQAHANVITEEDRTAYGDDLIDLTQRAARAAIAPELDALRAENQRLQTRVTSTGKRELFDHLDRVLPNWRQINQTTQFKTWLSLRNVYTGEVRQKMLNAAVNGAEAPKVIAMFKDFLSEATATGTMPQGQQQEQPPAPRVAAVDLGSLAAPGRAKPSSGDNQTPADKPTYTRAEIANYFNEKRKGLWAGRETLAQQIENDLGAAQREGRITG